MFLTHSELGSGHWARQALQMEIQAATFSGKISPTWSGSRWDYRRPNGFFKNKIVVSNIWKAVVQPFNITINQDPKVWCNLSRPERILPSLPSVATRAAVYSFTCQALQTVWWHDLWATKCHYWLVKKKWCACFSFLKSFVLLAGLPPDVLARNPAGSTGSTWYLFTACGLTLDQDYKASFHLVQISGKAIILPLRVVVELWQFLVRSSKFPNMQFWALPIFKFQTKLCLKLHFHAETAVLQMVFDRFLSTRSTFPVAQKKESKMVSAGMGLTP